MMYFINENSRWLDIKNVAITRMIKLIESRDLVNKLLLSIVATKESFEYNYEKNNEHTKKLLKNYQQVKRYQ